MEFSVTSAGLYPNRLALALGKIALLDSGYADAETLDEQQLVLLQEVIVRVSRDSADVEKTMSELEVLATNEELTDASKKGMADLLKFGDAALTNHESHLGDCARHGDSARGDSGQEVFGVRDGYVSDRARIHREGSDQGEEIERYASVRLQGKDNREHDQEDFGDQPEL